MWPRLQSSHEKPHWITVDFKHWEYQPEGSDESDDGEEAKKKKAMDPELREKVVRRKRDAHL